MINRGKDSKRGGRAGRLREIGRREIIGDRGEKNGVGRFTEENCTLNGVFR